MSKRGKLKQIAKEMGEPIEKLVPRIVAEESSTYRAAARLGVAPNTIRYWMLKLGYEATQGQSVVWRQIPVEVQS